MKKIYLFLLAAAACCSVSAQNLGDIPGPFLTPEGEARTYSCHTEGLKVVWGSVGEGTTTQASQVIYGPDNLVYFKVVPSGGMEGYVRGTIKGDKIEVKLPQNVGEMEFIDESYNTFTSTIYATLINCVYNIDINDLEVSLPESPINTVEYTLDADGTFSIEFPQAEGAMFPAQAIGLVINLDPTVPGNQTWIGYADFSEEYKVFTDTPTLLPEGLTTETWMMTYDSDGRKVSVAIDGNDFYLGNLSDELPDSYVKGVIEDGKVTFPLTYMGYSEEMENFLFFVPCDWQTLDPEKYGEDIEDYVIVDKYVFKYNAAAKTLKATAKNSAVMLGVSNVVGALAGAYAEYFYMPELFWLDPALADAPLQDPEIYAAYNMRDWYDCDIVEFFLPKFNKNDYPLDTNRMWYEFFIDGNLLTFTPEVYIGLKEPMTQVPYNFRDEDNQDIWTYGQEHQVSIFQTGYKTVGVKLYYDDPAGTTLESAYVEADIVKLSNGEIGGVAAVSAEAPAVKSIEYYDLQGRRVRHASNGLFIRTTRYTDGTTATAKVALK